VIVRSLNNETRKEKKVRPHRLAAVRDTVTDTQKMPARFVESKWSSVKKTRGISRAKVVREDWVK